VIAVTRPRGSRWELLALLLSNLLSGLKVKLPADVTIDAEVDLCNSGDAYFLRARLNISLPALEREVAQAIVACRTLRGQSPCSARAWTP